MYYLPPPNRRHFDQQPAINDRAVQTSQPVREDQYGSRPPRANRSTPPTQSAAAGAAPPLPRKTPARTAAAAAADDDADDEPITCAGNAFTFCTSTAMHGLRYVGTVSLSLFERVFFLLVFGSVFGLSVYYISNIYSKWTESPVIITLKAMRTGIAEIPFPAVTICNANQARRSEVEKFTQDSADQYLLRTLCKKGSTEPMPESYRPPPNSTKWSKFKLFLKRMARPCDEFLLTCRYGTQSMNCGDVFTTVLTDEGFCCNFNGVEKSFLLKDHVWVNWGWWWW